MAWKWYEGRVVRIHKESPNVLRFWLEVSDEEPFEYEGGQFVTMDLPIHEKRLKRWRSYSIANKADGSNILEFAISYMEDGAASEYFFKEVVVGTRIKFKGPSGTFCLPDEITSPLVMICTGTGIVPFRSMLQQHLSRITDQPIHLIFGTRDRSGILYKEEFENLQQKFTNFHYHIALSREEYGGYQGYVHDLYINLPPSITSTAHFFICGWQNMIDDAVANIMLKMKIDKSKIHYELYG